MLTYNRQQFVGRAIESILAQTLEDFELIVINNGSTDDSGKVAEAYAQKDGRIRVFHCERGNIGKGRNRGLDEAQGDYIAFFDDDDYCEPDFLQFLYDLAVENQADVAICGAADKAFDDKIAMTAEEAVIHLLWRKRYNMAFPTKLFTRKMAGSLHFPEEGSFDDIALMYKVLGQADRVMYHGLPKYTFYRHESNNSAWTTNHSLLNAQTLAEYLQVYQKRTLWLCAKFPQSEALFQYFTWSFMISMVEKIHRLQLKDCQVQLAYMEKELQNNRREFIDSPWIQDFEKEWMDKYV